jgi:hypothetical protein
MAMLGRDVERVQVVVGVLTQRSLYFPGYLL